MVRFLPFRVLASSVSDAENIHIPLNAAVFKSLQVKTLTTSCGGRCRQSAD
jgi:hypothetical protein